MRSETVYGLLFVLCSVILTITTSQRLENGAAEWYMVALAIPSFFYVIVYIASAVELFRKVIQYRR